MIATQPHAAAVAVAAALTHRPHAAVVAAVAQWEAVAVVTAEAVAMAVINQIHV